ncbi:MAG: metal-sensitive transcriptional regulator [Microgenomates group bacterium]|jgi:DNA-binding FrmR family transcriptional regulator
MTFRPKNTEERTLHRLKIAQGHLKKVIQMAESHEYCIDIIHQSQAVQKALKEVDNLILENHLKTCVADSIKKGREEEAIAEVMNIFKKNE